MPVKRRKASQFEVWNNPKNFMVDLSTPGERLARSFRSAQTKAAPAFRAAGNNLSALRESTRENLEKLSDRRQKVTSVVGPVAVAVASPVAAKKADTLSRKLTSKATEARSAASSALSRGWNRGKEALKQRSMSRQMAAAQTASSADSHRLSKPEPRVKAYISDKVEKGAERGREAWRSTANARRIAALAAVVLVGSGVGSDSSSVSHAEKKPTVSAPANKEAASRRETPKHIIPRVVVTVPIEVSSPSFNTSDQVLPKPSRDERIYGGELDEQRRVQAEADSKAAREQIAVERANKIARFQSAQRIGNIQLVETGDSTGTVHVLRHALRAGVLPSDLAAPPTARDFDSGLQEVALSGAAMHMNNANIPGIDDAESSSIGDRKPIIIAIHHLTKINDPLFPDEKDAFRYPEFLRFANPETGEHGDILTLDVTDPVTGEITDTRWYEAVGSDFIDTTAADQETEMAKVYGSKYPVVMYNCAQTPEELADQDHTVQHRQVFYFQEIDGQSGVAG